MLLPRSARFLSQPFDELRRPGGAVVHGRPRGHGAHALAIARFVECALRPPGARSPGPPAAPAAARRGRPSPAAPRSRPCRRPPVRRPRPRRSGAPARASRARRGTPPRPHRGRTASRRSTRPSGCSAGPTVAVGGGRRFQVASTRTRARANPATAALSMRCCGSCEVEGATTTSGASPAGGSMRWNGGSHSSGPTTCTWGGHSRGYSSCGYVPTSTSRSDSPPCTRSCGARPRRRRVSLSSSRPWRSPLPTGPRSAFHSPRPTTVRGRRAPSA